MRCFPDRLISKYLLRLGFAAAVLFTWALPANAQSSGLTEYQVKAAFIFNFAKFTDWPDASRDASLTVCIAGRDPFGNALSSFDGRNVGGREFRIRRIGTSEDLRGCHIVYITQSEERRLSNYLHAALNHPILTVSDIEGFVDSGGMIGLVVADERVQFDVNLTPTHAASLKLSSQVLRLARNVNGRGR